MEKEIETGYYGGQKVTVLSRYKVDGGIAIRVRRHPDAIDWPWTVDDFTTADENIKSAPIQMMDAVPALNANELLVLASLLKSSEANGHDFGFTNEWSACGLTPHQMAGYIGSLVKKSYIATQDLSDDPGTICDAVQFNFTAVARRLLGIDQ